MTRDISLSIIVSKMKVAPLKPITTLQLELMTAIPSLKLILSIIGALNILIADAHLWSKHYGCSILDLWQMKSDYFVANGRDLTGEVSSSGTTI